MRVTSTIQALRERCPSFNGRVYGALKWVTLSQVNPEGLPCAYVFTQSEDPKTFQLSENSYRQDVVATIAVVLCVPCVDTRGQEGADIVEDLKDEIFKALLGWAPTEDKLCVYEYSNYRVVDTSATPAMWCVQLEFTVDYILSEDDTHILIEQSALDKNNVGIFDKLSVDVDKIEDDGKPDGNIDEKLRIKGIYEGKAQNEPLSKTNTVDLW